MRFLRPGCRDGTELGWRQARSYGQAVEVIAKRIPELVPAADGPGPRRAGARRVRVKAGIFDAGRKGLDEPHSGAAGYFGEFVLEVAVLVMRAAEADEPGR